MIVLGLGSNLNDRLANLKSAYLALKQLAGLQIVQVSPVYLSDALLPENAPADWDLPHLNIAIRCETLLKPLELLDELKKIEWSIGRKPEARHWGPRILDIDILAWEGLVMDSERLTLPHKGLPERPFALWPLADVWPNWQFPLPGIYQNQTAAQIVEQWGSRFDGKAPFHTRQLQQRIDTPELMGIINLTPNSFSDGGCHQQADIALQHAIQLVADGASTLDIGAESTAPTSEAISAETEWQRLEPFLNLLNANRDEFIIQPKISIDTRHVDVAEKAIDKKIDFINDVSGLDDPAMRELIATSQLNCVFMHHNSIPERRYDALPRNINPIQAVLTWAELRLKVLLDAGISMTQLIFDPGIGFGKFPEQSLMILKNLSHFRSLGIRMLIGHSRKGFLSQFTDHPVASRDIETLSIALQLLDQPVDYIRVHHVDNCARAFKVAKYFS